MLRKLLVDRLTFEPVDDDGGKGYRFSGAATYGRLLSGEFCATSNGGPNGIRTRVSVTTTLSPVFLHGSRPQTTSRADRD